MKLNTYKSIFCIGLAVMLTACKKDFLNIVPAGKQVATTTNDYNLLLNSNTIAIYDFAGGWQGEVLMGDEVGAESSYFSSAQSVTQNAFEWKDDIFQPADIDWTAQNYLSNLYTINKVINEVSASAGGTVAQKNALLGEAEANRAWIYFQIINMYGKPYVTSSAASDPGFPIIKKADISATNFTRSTVQEVYDFIISDFTDAIAKLPVQNGNAIRFNKAAAEGLLGKVYLYMGKNDQALTLFNAAFTDNASQTTPARLYDYNKELAPDGNFYPVNSDGPSNSPGQNVNDVTESLVARSFYNSYYSGNGFGIDGFVITPQTVALFDASDLRLQFFTPLFPFGQPNPSGRLSKYNSEQYTKFGLQISELYLLRAECKARLNDLAGAKADVETLRKARMPVANATIPSNVSSDKTAMVKYIFDERTREFAEEGYRWFDMRRLSVDPLFPAATYIHTLYNNSDNTTTTYTLNPVRLTLRLPYYITSTNPTLQNNP